MGRIIVLSAIVGALIVLAAGCSGSPAKRGNDKAGEAYSPNIDPADFSTNVDNKYFPLKPGTTFVYEGTVTENNKDISERDEMAVTHQTKQIMGVACVEVNDKVWEEGKLIEQTYDWYAQDKKGNVWYLGEDSKEYENGKVTSTKGSWKAGVDGAKPGIIMQAHPNVGQTYRQEYYKGEAEDMAKVLSLEGSAKVPYSFFDHVLVTKDWNPLEPNLLERKYYADGVGNVMELAVKGPPERIELVEVKSG